VVPAVLLGGLVGALGAGVVAMAHQPALTAAAVGLCVTLSAWALTGRWVVRRRASVGQRLLRVALALGALAVVLASLSGLWGWRQRVLCERAVDTYGALVPELVATERAASELVETWSTPGSLLDRAWHERIATSQLRYLERHDALFDRWATVAAAPEPDHEQASAVRRRLQASMEALQRFRDMGGAELNALGERIDELEATVQRASRVDVDAAEEVRAEHTRALQGIVPLLDEATRSRRALVETLDAACG